MLLFNAMGIFKELAAVCYFNASHVIIQPNKTSHFLNHNDHFNTSHVIIQLHFVAFLP